VQIPSLRTNFPLTKMDTTGLPGNYASWDLFWSDVKPYLGFRKDSFQLIFDHLKKIESPLIVETGSLRNIDGIGGDGISTVMFDRFLQYHGGKGVTIDIQPSSWQLVSESTRHFKPITGDSIAELAKVEGKADLLYLDSYDVDWNNPWPSAAHHLKELFSANSLLKDGTLIVVDDNQINEAGINSGKGFLIGQYFDFLGISPVFSMYQVGWFWKAPTT
jgi:hypothetical protein